MITISVAAILGGSWVTSEVAAILGGSWVTFRENDHHARSREDGIFCHLVAVTVHVTFMYQCFHTFYSNAPDGLKRLSQVFSFQSQEPSNKGRLIV